MTIDNDKIRSVLGDPPTLANFAIYVQKRKTKLPYYEPATTIIQSTDPKDGARSETLRLPPHYADQEMGLTWVIMTKGKLFFMLQTLQVATVKFL